LNQEARTPCCTVLHIIVNSLMCIWVVILQSSKWFCRH
jgi:hypothetical protein